jgi:glyoxylase-like metal-dependent hydrolase (beta-lactamase superfamily II)/rhodanese-related sulfurtransferase
MGVVVVLKQYYLGCLAHASYLVADQGAGVAAVVDPQRDVDEYVADAGELGCRIEHVLLTHLHADFLAGHLELRDRVGAQIYLGARAEAEYAFTPLADGDMIEFGRVRLEALETPGHSPESISILVFDLDADAVRPHAVLTGDTLFIGDVGRPDLRASLGWSAEALGSLLYDSVQQKLLPLPDDTLVYPAHGAGSLCGKHLSTETVSTIGIQRQYNYALQPMTREEFIRVVTADQPDSPAYFTYDAVLNTKERATLDEALAEGLTPLSLDAVLDLVERGSQLLDARASIDFAGAHLRGSINIGLDGSYATWAGTLLDHERPIVIVAEPGREEEAALRLGRIGFDNVAGYLDGGMLALDGNPELVEWIDRITAATLAEQLAEPDPPFVLDVRTESEAEELSVEGSTNIPLSRLLEHLDELPGDRPIVVHCGSGYRSSIAASLLRRNGFDDITDLVGGLSRPIQVSSARSA